LINLWTTAGNKGGFSLSSLTANSGDAAGYNTNIQIRFVLHNRTLNSTHSIFYSGQWKWSQCFEADATGNTTGNIGTASDRRFYKYSESADYKGWLTDQFNTETQQLPSRSSGSSTWVFGNFGSTNYVKNNCLIINDTGNGYVVMGMGTVFIPISPTPDWALQVWLYSHKANGAAVVASDYDIVNNGEQLIKRTFNDGAGV
jgi:hypothetical protein